MPITGTTLTTLTQELRILLPFRIPSQSSYSVVLEAEAGRSRKLQFLSLESRVAARCPIFNDPRSGLVCLRLPLSRHRKYDYSMVWNGEFPFVVVIFIIIIIRSSSPTSYSAFPFGQMIRRPFCAVDPEEMFKERRICCSHSFPAIIIISHASHFFVPPATSHQRHLPIPLMRNTRRDGRRDVLEIVS